MRKIFLVFAAGISLASCGSSSDQSQANAQHSLDSMKTEMVKQQTIDSMNAATAAQPAPAEPVTHSSTSSTVHNNYNTTNNNAGATPAEKKKKGWSAKADGTLIGAGAGALTGAVVDKKHGQGAVIGGVVGAAAGLGTGAIIDKKNGR